MDAMNRHIVGIEHRAGHNPRVSIRIYENDGVTWKGWFYSKDDALTLAAEIIAMVSLIDNPVDLSEVQT